MPKEQIVIRRDGQIREWNGERIRRAISLAYFDVLHPYRLNPNRNSSQAKYGLDESQWEYISGICQNIENQVEKTFFSSDDSEPPTVEDIQDIVEESLQEQDPKIGFAYSEYRKSREVARAMENPSGKVQAQTIDTPGMSDFQFNKSYANYRPEEQRKEVWDEAVSRGLDFYRKRFEKDGRWSPELKTLVEEAFNKGVREKKVLPSMRSMQFAGPAMEKQEQRVYNCWFCNADRERFFAESFHLLLCGGGVGYSVQDHHVEKLPEIQKATQQPVKWIAGVERKYQDPKHPEYKEGALTQAITESLNEGKGGWMDSIEGWADTLDIVMQGGFEGFEPEFDWNYIRPRGAIIKTTGGTAPGPDQLKRSIEAVQSIVTNSRGRNLRPIEAHDIMCHAAQAVLSGGIRRSAMIVLFSPTNKEMLEAKSGEWFKANPQRAAANNSIAVHVDDPNREIYHKTVFDILRREPYGEPGEVFLTDLDCGTNPCGEIGLKPYHIITTQEEIDELKSLGATKQYQIGDKISGFQACNLTEINVAAAKTPEEFIQFAKYAAIIGTVQADLTDFKYLSPETRFICERDRLLGCGITGVTCNPDIALNPEILKQAALAELEANAQVASLLGNNPSTNVATIKPAGSTSIILGCSSGMHPTHDRRYLRRIQAPNDMAYLKAFADANPHLVSKMGVRHPEGKINLPPPRAGEVYVNEKGVYAGDFFEHETLGPLMVQWGPEMDPNKVGPVKTQRQIAENNFEKWVDHVHHSAELTQKMASYYGAFVGWSRANYIQIADQYTLVDKQMNTVGKIVGRCLTNSVTKEVIKNPKTDQPYILNDSGYGATDKNGMPVDCIVTFASNAPRGALVKKDMSAMDLVKIKRTLQEHYIDVGRRVGDDVRPGHNVSCTINYKPEELDELEKEILRTHRTNRAFAVLPDYGGAAYAQAPHLEIDSNTMNYWLDCRMVQSVQPPKEEMNTTNFTLEAACAGGKCEIPGI